MSSDQEIYLEIPAQVLPYLLVNRMHTNEREVKSLGEGRGCRTEND